MSTSLDEALAKRPQLTELIRHARTANWYVLGVLLALETDKLDAIKVEYSGEGERLLQMYQLWLAKRPNATNSDVIEALKSKPLEEITVAENFKKFLIGSSGKQYYVHILQAILIITVDLDDIVHSDQLSSHITRKLITVELFLSCHVCRINTES